MSLDDLGPEDRALLEPVAAGLRAGGAISGALSVVRTDGGPVVLVAPPLPPGAALRS